MIKQSFCVISFYFAVITKILKEKIRNLSLENDAIFTGLRSDVNDLLQVMDAFVFPSLYEGMPLALIEAQASGIQCYISDRVISKEVKITDLVHFISLKQEASEWAEKIFSNKEKALKRENMLKNIVDAGFDIEDTKNELVEFYTSLYTGGKQNETQKTIFNNFNTNL